MSYNVRDFYWEHADKLLRGLGVKESVYDERVLAFMALKMLSDNDLIKFNFDYNKNFGAKKEHIVLNKDKSINLRQTFLNLVVNILEYDNTNFFISDKKGLKKYQRYNLDKLGVKSELEAFNHKEIFHFDTYILELKNDDNLKLLCDIYNDKANFKGYPRNKYKNLYEEIVTRMKVLSGSLTGQHFTQDNIIKLMTRVGADEKVVRQKIKSKEMYRIYDLACGVGSMLYESAYYLNEIYKLPLEQVELLGQELNGPTWLLAKVFCEVQEIKNFIAYGNTLTDPFVMDFVRIKGNDIHFIIANPPFGTDWKSEESRIKKHIMDNTKWDGVKLLENNSNFYIFETGDKKNLFALPKISDGQFLFFMHNLRIMELTEIKASKSVILSSIGLANGGAEGSNESVIRKGIIERGFLDCLIEQPKNMFVNTDIKTHFWVLNEEGTEKRKNETFLINVDNDFTHLPFNGQKELRVLFGDAPVKLEKQKNAYSIENIDKLYEIYVTRKDGADLFYKNKKFSGSDYSINFAAEFKKEGLGIIKFDVIDMLKFMESAYFGTVEPKVAERAMKLLDGTLIADEYFNKYEELYKNLLKDPNNLTKQEFYNKIKELEQNIMKNIKKTILGQMEG